MNWQGAINLNRDALKRIVSAVLVMAGITAGCALTLVPAATRAMLLRVVRPAESALRRLIVIAARDLPAPDKRHDARPLPDFSALEKHAARTPSFALFDRRKRFETCAKTPVKGVPRLTIWGVCETAFAPAPDTKIPDGMADAARLGRRLKALIHALDHLPAQARRLAKNQARRAALPPGPKSVGPMRPGLPPGHVRQPAHEVDHVLNECHGLALQAREAPT